jgi:5-methylcytosine-specific restriction endonuclease McrA
MKIDNKNYTLILSKSFIPLGVEKVKKVMKYLINDQGRALDTETYQLFSFDEWIEFNNMQEQDITIRTEKLWIRIPEIVVLNRDSVYTKKRANGISPRKVFERDNYTCNYCECTLNSKNRTIDHVHPRSKGGQDTYDNVVACCGKCNSEKGNILLHDLHKNGPHKMDENGKMLVHRDRRWTIKTQLVCPTQSVLFGVPKQKWMESWRTFLPKEMDLV